MIVYSGTQMNGCGCAYVPSRTRSRAAATMGCGMTCTCPACRQSNPIVHKRKAVASVGVLALTAVAAFVMLRRSK